jgi:hypothetical protein
MIEVWEYKDPYPDRAGSLDSRQGPEATGALNMPLRRDFKETVKARAEKDSAFRETLLTEALDCFLAGDTDTGKAMLPITSTPRWALRHSVR